MSDEKGNITRNPDAVNYNSNGNEKVTHNINRNFDQKLLSNRTITFVAPKTNMRNYQRIALIVVTSQTLLIPAMKEVVTDAALGSV